VPHQAERDGHRHDAHPHPRHHGDSLGVVASLTAEWRYAL
jgi:hypothetical protein